MWAQRPRGVARRLTLQKYRSLALRVGYTFLGCRDASQTLLPNAIPPTMFHSTAVFSPAVGSAARPRDEPLVTSYYTLHFQAQRQQPTYPRVRYVMQMLRQRDNERAPSAAQVCEELPATSAHLVTAMFESVQEADACTEWTAEAVRLDLNASYHRASLPTPSARLSARTDLDLTLRAHQLAAESLHCDLDDLTHAVSLLDRTRKRSSQALASQLASPAFVKGLDLAFRRGPACLVQEYVEELLRHTKTVAQGHSPSRGRQCCGRQCQSLHLRGC